MNYSRKYLTLVHVELLLMYMEKTPSGSVCFENHNLLCLNRAFPLQTVSFQ